jgi:hypothetical protein
LYADVSEHLFCSVFIDDVRRKNVYIYCLRIVLYVSVSAHILQYQKRLINIITNIGLRVILVGSNFYFVKFDLLPESLDLYR